MRRMAKRNPFKAKPKHKLTLRIDLVVLFLEWTIEWGGYPLSIAYSIIENKTMKVTFRIVRKQFDWKNCLAWIILIVVLGWLFWK